MDKMQVIDNCFHPKVFGTQNNLKLAMVVFSPYVKLFKGMFLTTPQLQLSHCNEHLRNY